MFRGTPSDTKGRQAAEGQGHECEGGWFWHSANLADIKGASHARHQGNAVLEPAAASEGEAKVKDVRQGILEGNSAIVHAVCAVVIAPERGIEIDREGVVLAISHRRQTDRPRV